MCRFTLYHGPPIRLSALLTEPDHSLIHQSVHSAERDEPLNGDGFGVAWYAPSLGVEPGLFRSITPAWSNSNLSRLARVIESPCVLAHVRAATSGDVIETNCHPFVSGRFAFMHNGDVGGFAKVRRPLQQLLSDEAFAMIQGRTDSEHLFALFLDAHAVTSGNDPASIATALRNSMARAVALVREHSPGEHCYLNLAVTDGRTAVVSRFTTDTPDQADSLYINVGRRYVCDGGTCRMVDPARGNGAVIVSSERLSDDPGWDPVPVNHLVIIREDGNVAFEHLEAVALA